MCQGSCDRDNSAVQTAAMGQIPRLTERKLILVSIYVWDDFEKWAFLMSLPRARKFLLACAFRLGQFRQ